MARPTKLSKELSGAFAEEQTRQAIDAAKKKAVAQHADYDTFKKMVSVAHLKPIQAPGTHGSKAGSLPAWQLDPSRLAACISGSDVLQASSAVASHGSEQQQAQHQVQQGVTPPAVTLKQHRMLPRTSQEFAREWRKNCPTPEAKHGLLKQCGAEGLSCIFRVEVDGVMLGQLLQTLQQQWRPQACISNTTVRQEGAAAAVLPPPPLPQLQQHAEASQQQQEPVVDGRPKHCQYQLCAGSSVQCPSAGEVTEAVGAVQMLKSLTGAGRFDLNVRLMDRPSKTAAAELCSQLEAVLQLAATQQQQQHGQDAGCTGDNPPGSPDALSSQQHACSSIAAVATGSSSSSVKAVVDNTSDSQQSPDREGPGTEQLGLRGGVGSELPEGPEQDPGQPRCATISVQQALQELQQVMVKLRL